MRRTKDPEITNLLPGRDRELLVEAARDYVQTLRVGDHSMVAALTVACEAHVKRFSEEQSARQKEAIRQMRAAADSTHTKAKFPWCRVQLRYRVPKTSVVGQIYWIDVKRHPTIPRRVIHSYIPGRGGIYDLKVLARRAQDFDRDLVVQAELQARQLRRLMAVLKACRRSSHSAFLTFGALRDPCESVSQQRQISGHEILMPARDLADLTSYENF